MDEGWFNATLDEQYELIKTLKSNDDTQIHVLRHRTLGRDMVKRVYKGTGEVYKLLRSLAHPNIVNVYEVFTGSDYTVVLEEYINGQTVAEVLETGLYHTRGAINIVHALCDALEILHTKGIIHRDIKPENIMIDEAGMVKLIDFDAAKLYKSYKSDDTRIMGTAGYAAPEQFGLAQSDERTDIFALGVLMNVMLTGSHPSKKLYSGKLKSIIEKCIQTNPGKRYQSVTQLQESL